MQLLFASSSVLRPLWQREEVNMNFHIAVVVFVGAALFGPAHSIFFGPSQDWDGLKVTWGLNPFSSYTFAAIPRTETEAREQNWVRLDSDSESNYFCGSRYHKFDSELNAYDSAVMPLYDKNGYIAGIQSGIPDTLDNGFPSGHIQPPFIHDQRKGWFTLTAYFSDPSVVCGAGRTAAQFEREGTGTNLGILNGDRTNVTIIPYSEVHVPLTGWIKGRCFFTMGQHYWYRYTYDMPCDQIYPVFAMYNNGRVNAFGFTFQGFFSSPRYEHPEFSDLGSFMNPVPQCLATAGRLSTIHIYMDDSPRTNTC